MTGSRQRPPPYLDYLLQVSESATWVCSVCEGALLLAQAGLLGGHKATTHWAFIACLSQFPEIAVDQKHQRFIVSENASGKRLTGGGISSGLDESLKLIELLFGEEVAKDVQVTTQYFPKSPVSGSLPANSPPCPMKWT